MRTLSLLILGSVMVGARLPEPATRTVAADPCTHATTTCERWIVFGAGPARSMVYANYALDARNTAITRALVMVHGAGIDHFGRLTARAAKGTLVLTTRSSHFLHATEPELAVWGIRRVLSWGAPHPELERFVGQYPLAPGFTIAITREDDKLLIQATGQPAFAMAAESPTSFSIKMVGAVIEFETDPTGKVTGLTLVQNGMRQRAPKTK
jgi:hypothetical protein